MQLAQDPSAPRGSWNTAGPASFSTCDEAGMQLIWDLSAPIIVTPMNLLKAE